ncbi:helix-turn-helix domain-containing protein [Mycobacteroides abscessus]|uniref:helix-turn-helix domain-containing protein n=1 Tax=Mycobacteroides abscessus TaxID=36809 RepID=UPI000697C98F|nr:LysR family transcriptional regulator [Mycobacteroides abscessus]
MEGIGGRDRLERFAEASQYRTMTIAGERLSVHQFTLVNQINRIERELGTKLLVRAERGRPTRLIDTGAGVVAAVRAYARQGGPA